jgi:hypothetical protein
VKRRQVVAVDDVICALRGRLWRDERELAVVVREERAPGL